MYIHIALLLVFCLELDSAAVLSRPLKRWGGELSLVCHCNGRFAASKVYMSDPASYTWGESLFDQRACVDDRELIMELQQTISGLQQY